VIVGPRAKSNRAQYQHVNGAGFNYGLAVNYDSWSYDQMGRLTQIQDTGRNYRASVAFGWIMRTPGEWPSCCPKDLNYEGWSGACCAEAFGWAFCCDPTHHSCVIANYCPPNEGAQCPIDFCFQPGMPCYDTGLSFIKECLCGGGGRGSCRLNDPTEYKPSGLGANGPLHRSCIRISSLVNWTRQAAMDCIMCYLAEAGPEDGASVWKKVLALCALGNLGATEYRCLGCCPWPYSRVCCTGSPVDPGEQALFCPNSYLLGRPVVLLCYGWMMGGEDFLQEECNRIKTLIHEAFHGCGVTDLRQTADRLALEIVRFCRPYCRQI